jgi:hypothetical protein
MLQAIPKKHYHMPQAAFDWKAGGRPSLPEVGSSIMVGVASLARYGNKYATFLFGPNSMLLKSKQFSTSTG